MSDSNSKTIGIFIHENSGKLDILFKVKPYVNWRTLDFCNLKCHIEILEFKILNFVESIVGTSKNSQMCNLRKIWQYSKILFALAPLYFETQKCFAPKTNSVPYICQIRNFRLIGIVLITTLFSFAQSVIHIWYSKCFNNAFNPKKLFITI